jgi:hypothetical protein
MTEKRFCQCGCGQELTPFKETRPGKGKIAGWPRFIKGHDRRGQGWRGPRQVYRGPRPRPKKECLTDKQGYLHILCPDHPRAGSRGYVPQQILVAEKVIGHFLPLTAEVHHHDRNPQNNEPDNLVILNDRSHHALVTRRQVAYEACGNAKKRKCGKCGVYDFPENMPKRRGNTPLHESCEK